MLQAEGSRDLGRNKCHRTRIYCRDLISKLWVRQIETYIKFRFGTKWGKIQLQGCKQRN